jgi:hypothetical protein
VLPRAPARISSPFPTNQMNLIPSHAAILATLLLSVSLPAQVWELRTPSSSPSVRRRAAMTFDEARGHCLMYGGDICAGFPNGFVDDTWTWDGVTWSQLTPAVRPPGRNLHGLAYDRARARVVLFGGSSFGGFRNDTWEWDGTNWTQQNPTTRPPVRSGLAMAYDTSRAYTLVFGGWNGVAARLGDTWAWNGTNWTAMAPTNAPSGREASAMADDPIRSRVVLYGGADATWNGVFGDTWEWDGTTWTLTGATQPGPMAGHQMAWYPARNGVALLGNGTWIHDGTDWEQIQLTGPVTAVASDPVRACLVAFGGGNGNCPGNAATWELCQPQAACADSLVANGNVVTGVVAGGMQSSGAAAGWARITGDPVVVTTAGCDSPGCFRMAGNRTTGDSVRQSVTGFQIGHTYRVKFCHRFVAEGSSAQTTVRFRVTATADASPTAYPSSSLAYTLVCRTPPTSSTAWTEFVADWTPSTPVANLAINAENDLGGTAAANLSWGEIDDVCITEVPFYAAFVFDRSDEMLAVQSNLQTRAANSVTAATADIAAFFLQHPFGRVQIHEFLGTTVNQIGGSGTSFTSAAAATAALSSLATVVSGKPLAQGLCTATAALAALDPEAEPWQRTMFLYCCGGDDGSPTSSCRGTAPEAGDGNRCAQMPADLGHPSPFTAGSWQQAVCDLLHAQIEIHAYYWDDFLDTVGQADLVAALCDLTGGTMTRVWDASTAPVANPWRVVGTGCEDFHGTRLSMTHDGMPQIGTAVGIGCRTSSPQPAVLGVGFDDTSIGGRALPLDLGGFGAPGCRLYTSWDVTDSFLAWHGVRTLAIPPAPGLVGLTLHWQGLQLHVLNNQLGVATSNLLQMTIVP